MLRVGRVGYTLIRISRHGEPDAFRATDSDGGFMWQDDHTLSRPPIALSAPWASNCVMNRSQQSPSDVHRKVSL